MILTDDEIDIAYKKAQDWLRSNKKADRDVVLPHNPQYRGIDRYKGYLR